MLAVPYNLFERVRMLVAAHHGQILDKDFGAGVTITAQFEIERFPTFQIALQTLSNGVLQAKIIETNETLMPLNPSI
jgi:putative IMPACT (imprinted ancient) family translation regulator